MASEGFCGCKGVRNCFVCNRAAVLSKLESSQKFDTYWYCPSCSGIYEGDVGHTAGNPTHIDWCGLHTEHDEVRGILNGLYVEENFVTLGEEKNLVTIINREEWKCSQSGRRKQDFGPKVNFKRKKLKLSGFTGLPGYSKYLTERLQSIDVLENFSAVELCNLEYVPERGSSIDPHIDDTWLWGEYLVTVNLLSNSILTLTNPNMNSDIEIQVPMPRRSLLTIWDSARYEWLHEIKPHHIKSKRIAMTLRNLSKEFRSSGNQWEIGQEVVKIANTFNGSVVL